MEIFIPVQQGLKDSNPPADGRDGKTHLAADLRIAEPAALPHVINQHVAVDHVRIRYATGAFQSLNDDIQYCRHCFDDLTEVHIIENFSRNRKACLMFSTQIILFYSIGWLEAAGGCPSARKR